MTVHRLGPWRIDVQRREALERAIEQAADGRGGQTGDVRWTPAEELRLLVPHGTLHLCGWDHAEAEEEAAMRALERRLLG